MSTVAVLAATPLAWAGSTSSGPFGKVVYAPAWAATLSHPAWKIAHSPDATVPNGHVQSISCSAADACTAVGAALGAAGLDVTHAERWDGQSWKLQSMPSLAANTVPLTSPELSGVSCPAPKFCEAVGSYQLGNVGVILAERWNGLAWTTQSPPAPAGATYAILRQVSCTSAQFCEAVGAYGSGTGQRLPFAAKWDGSSWHVQRIPVLAGAELTDMNSVSCPSATFCEATGGSDVGPFAVGWSGASWRLQKVPGQSIGSVSCVSATFCEATGFAGDLWNGSSWTAQTIPSPAGSTSVRLSGVSCVTATFCEAVGSYSDNSGDTLDLAATWNGAAWALQGTPAVPGRPFASLNAVSCASVSACEAGGASSISASQDPLFPLAAAWNGSSWSPQRAAPALGAASNALAGVSCVSAVLCEAVGSRQDRLGTTTIALAEKWNGSRWRIQQTANPAQVSGGFRMSLSAVSCASASFCEAVGSSASAAGAGAEKWNGKAWVLQVAPGGPLTSVSCLSATFCMAAGGDGHVEIWNGSSWSSKSSAAGFGSLRSVSCASPTVCEAIGSGPPGEQAERWNGKTWSPQATPVPAGGSSLALTAVSCAQPTSCEAVGSYSTSDFQQVPLAEARNGGAWTVQHVPSPSSSAFSSSAFNAVWCISPTFCTAVGQVSDVLNNTLAEVWNGSRWSLRATPSYLYAGQNTLSAVSCTTGPVCRAVGATDDLGQISANLIETGN